MKKIISDKLPRIIKAKKQLEKELNIKLTNRGKEVYIDGKPEDEYVAEKVIDALNLGFPLDAALLLKDEDYLFEVINIKDHTKRQDLARVRGRIIGTDGKALRNLNNLTDCYFEIKDNNIGIIGHVDAIENAQQAIISLIKGSKHSNVYAYLEKHQPEEVIDFGLKK